MRLIGNITRRVLISRELFLANVRGNSVCREWRQQLHSQYGFVATEDRVILHIHCAVCVTSIGWMDIQNDKRDVNYYKFIHIFIPYYMITFRSFLGCYLVGKGKLMKTTNRQGWIDYWTGTAWWKLGSTRCGGPILRSYSYI